MLEGAVLLDIVAGQQERKKKKTKKNLLPRSPSSMKMKQPYGLQVRTPKRRRRMQGWQQHGTSDNLHQKENETSKNQSKMQFLEIKRSGHVNQTIAQHIGLKMTDRWGFVEAKVPKE